MKLARIVTLLSVMLLVCGCIGTVEYEPVNYDTTFQVAPWYLNEQQVTLNSLGTLEGSFTITGGDRGIYFYITDPYGSTVYGQYYAVGQTSFSIKNHYTGIYRLYFENGVSTYTKTISLHIYGYPD